ncbi:septum site-determining protein MinC [Roseomonas sp. NAR14]|uniref:Probable septum site-determining protein MinC n=1 Tax=Roseomonas acroporae TaxID=2937791 RepID=A0A9X1YCX5_9PROT|nr:septum site-determining protein MinC [Roseomonas acroporae]MCK8786695.1 septum site-determining protein MinC [Roseomonas acroporae]
MSAAPEPASMRTEPFRLRGANFNLLVLRLLDPRPEAVLPALGTQFRQAPGFLRFAPIVIGLAELEASAAEVDFRALVAGLRQLEILPIGTTGGTQELRLAAQAAGLPPLKVAGGREPDPVPEPPPPPPPPPAPESLPAMIVATPVRSGQRIYAQGRDLIVTATVNPGAELIADGNIHVYGALRGRAIAGGGENLAARVFALQFDPELVSIAGYYTVRDGLTRAPIGRAVQVWLDGEQLRFEPLG